MRKLFALTGVVLAVAAATASSAAPSGYALSPTLQALLQRDVAACGANAVCSQVLAGALNACSLDPVCEPALVSFLVANPYIFTTILGKTERKSISIFLGQVAFDPTLGQIMSGVGIA
jgi:hypothetical protein